MIASLGFLPHQNHNAFNRCPITEEGLAAALHLSRYTESQQILDVVGRHGKRVSEVMQTVEDTRPHDTKAPPLLQDLPARHTRRSD